MTEGGTLTLVYAARDEHEHNARVLAEWLEQEGERLNRPSSPTFAEVWFILLVKG